MSENSSDTVTVTSRTAEVVEKIFSAGDVGAVFSEPVVSGEHTLIAAAEVWAGGGYGFGLAPTERDIEPGDEEREIAQQGGGGGGGGGGTSGARPVAMIIVGPRGVEVQPILDLTKVALAFFTMLGSLIVMLNKIRRAGRA